MIPVGYKYKKVQLVADLEWFQSDSVKDVYSVSDCISEDFTDYIDHWKHNVFWFFDTPAVMEEIAESESVDMSGMTLFFYEMYEKEYNDSTHCWESFLTDEIVTNLPEFVPPKEKKLEGFDVVSFSCGNAPECSPLSCNWLHQKISVNQHCLFDTFDEAKDALNRGVFTNSEPGPYRIFAVYTVSRRSIG